MKKLLFVLVLLCVAAGTTNAQNVFQWFGGEPANSDWNYGMNWKNEADGTFGVVPDAAAKTKINNVKWGSIAEPLIGGANGTQTITIGDVFIAEAGAGLSPESVNVGVGGTLNVVGAGGTAEGQINMGYQAGAVGGLNINGGTVNVSGPVHVGWGGDGTLTINGGGVMNAFFVDIAGDTVSGTGTGHIAVNNGTLIIRGFQGDLMQSYADLGLLTSTGTLVIAYDDVLDQTTVTPEPATMLLLGLGGLLLKRRS